MRAPSLPAALLVGPLLLACKVDIDPFDNLTQGATGDASGDASTTDPGGTSNPTTGNNSGETTTGATDPTDGPGSTTQTTATTGQATITSTTGSTGDPSDPYEAARQLCVDTINMYRATLGLPPYARWTDAETCSDAEAQSDGETDTPHGAFGMCGEWAQNECPGWPGPPERSLPQCLAQMWAEGPGEDFNLHGHYLNMSSEQYTRVACGFAEVGDGNFWMVQNFQ